MALTLAKAGAGRRLAYQALILVFLCAQSLASVHQHEPGQVSGHGCALCVYANHASHAIPSTGLVLPVTVSCSFDVTIPATSPIPATSTSFRSRAPPPVV